MTTTDSEKKAAEIEPRATAGTTATAGLDENVAGALAYLFGVVTGVVFFLVDDRAFVRFHAAQSIAISAVLFVVYVALSILQLVVSALFFAGVGGGGAFALGSALSLLLGLVWLVVALGGFGLWLYLLVRAYQGETPRIPVASGLADRLLGGRPAE